MLERASGGDLSATTGDVHLRDMELVALQERISELGHEGAFRLLDVGCGDAYTTLKLAEAFPRATVVGVDFAEQIPELARGRLAALPDVGLRISLFQGDASRLGEAVGEDPFDVIVSSRSLINLEISDQQYEALESIADGLTEGGHYVGVENFMEGQTALNDARVRLDLPEIPVRWHNRLFTEDAFRQRTARFFSDLAFSDFASTCYFATRVVYSAICRWQGEEPEYHHPIHQHGHKLPHLGSLSPVRLISAPKRPATEDAG